MFAHLHVRSWFSFLRGGSSPRSLAAAAAAEGASALALTDVDGVYGAVRFQQACAEREVRPIYGAELRVRVDGVATPKPLVLLAQSPLGYENLCRLLSAAHRHDRACPSVTLDALAARAGDLQCLTGTREGLLWEFVDAERPTDADAWVYTLLDVLGRRLSIELAHHRRPGDDRRIRRLLAVSRRTGVPAVATGDVRYATPQEYRRYDLLTCIGTGTTVFDAHPDRPTNAEAFLVSRDELERRLPVPEAFDRAAELAEACHVDLVPGEVTPPAADLPHGVDPDAHLRRLCAEAFPRRYRPEEREAAGAQVRRELGVIRELGLAEFFLVVHEVVAEARRRRIRCAGRGSAANSIVAYLLGITAVDPLAHGLLFERFLHRGRRGTPDIDVDFDSDRRGEVIAWMERRFGSAQTAMTATLITYRLRSALRDTAKALGWPTGAVNRLGKAVPHASAHHAPEHRVSIEQVLGKGPLVDALIEAAAGLEGCPRHLGLHSGGMVLSRRPLPTLTPVQASANGVKQVQFDKDDVEALGLVKLDVLGLRMLAVLSEAEDLVRRHEGIDLELDALPLDDEATFELVRSGRTMGCFQIESHGQMHLLAQHQPETFGDLITEIALFRPGPLQTGMVHPFVRRRRGLEPVTYEHPSLRPILEDTYGVILFQEQVLEVAHRFAGLSLEEADRFRRLMSSFRDPGEMEGMRALFVGSAVGRGVPEEAAERVFDDVSKFVGYGFCRSHAAAFARTVYQSAYLKRHHPAAFLAAVMEHRPGMFNLMSLQEEARRFGARTLQPDVNASGVRYDLERDADGRLAIRMPLSAVKGVGVDAARAVVLERLRRPYESLEDLWRRVPVETSALKALARAGALDGLLGADPLLGSDPLRGSDGRRALWHLGVLERRLGSPGASAAPTLFSQPVVEALDVPDLAELTRGERLVWDLETTGTARAHPMTLVRRMLGSLEVRPIETCFRLGRTAPLRAHGPRPVVTVGGVITLRQRPPTANGVLFMTLEDETGFIQCVVRPAVQEHLDHHLRRQALIVRGHLHAKGNWRGLVVTDAWPLDGAFGGYEGQLDYAGGRDRRVLTPERRAGVAAGAPPPDA